MRHALDMEDLHDISSVPPKATKGSKKEPFTRELHLNSLKALLMRTHRCFRRVESTMQYLLMVQDDLSEG